MTCKKCGKKLKRNDKFCGGCGAPVPKAPEKPVCPKCGKVLDADSKFCNSCGAAVNSGTGGTGEYSWKKGEEKVSWSGEKEKPIKAKRGKKKPLLIVLTLAAVVAAGCFLYDFYLDQIYERDELNAVLAQFAEDESSQQYQMDSALKDEINDAFDALKNDSSAASSSPSNGSTNSSSSSKNNTTSSSASDASVLPNFIDCDRSGWFEMKRANHGDVYCTADSRAGNLNYVVEEYIDRLVDMGYEITFDHYNNNGTYKWTLEHDQLDGEVRVKLNDFGPPVGYEVVIEYTGDITMKGISTSSNGGSSGGGSSNIDFSDRYDTPSKVPCAYCDDGDCKDCGGDGYKWSHASDKEDLMCGNCSFGSCYRCGGDGWIND